MFTRLCRRLGALAMGLAIVGGLALGTPDAWAGDKIYLKDGTVVEGEIKQELDGYVWVLTKIGGVETEVIYKPDQIDRIERDADQQAPPAEETPKARSTPGSEPASKPRRDHVVRAAVLSLGDHRAGKDMVGVYMTADSLRRAIPLLEKELGSDGSGILVLRISSGGGMLLEIQKLSDVIEYELKPRFRVVGWIDSAISAAAMTAHAIEELYFTSDGHYGACTGWFGQLNAVKGRDLEEVLYMMEKISARGGYDPKIMRSMQINEPLSCSIDEFGNVTWYQTEDGGEFLVNPGDEILTFTSDQAEKFKFSKGTADTIDELARAMGVPEVEWVGEYVQGIPYPVCEAEKMMRQFRDQVAEDEARTREYFDRYNTSIAAAQSTPREERGKFVNRARQALRLIERMVANNPNFSLLVFNRTYEEFQEWVREQERLLRDLMR